MLVKIISEVDLELSRSYPSSAFARQGIKQVEQVCRNGMEQGFVRFVPKLVDCVKSTWVPHHILGRKFQPRLQGPTFQTTPS